MISLLPADSSCFQGLQQKSFLCLGKSSILMQMRIQTKAVHIHTKLRTYIEVRGRKGILEQGG